MPPQAPAAGGHVPTPEEVLTALAKREGVDPRLVLSVAQVESSLRWDPPPSSAGALGIMQVMPETARRHGLDPNDRVQNALAGIRELKQLSQQYKAPPLVFRRYNGSPQAPVEMTDPYVYKAMAEFRRRAGLPPARPGEDTDGRITQSQWRPPMATPPPRPPLAAAAGPGPTPFPSASRMVGQGAERVWDGTKWVLSEGGPHFVTETLPWAAKAGVTGLAESYNPMTRTGRQNIAGGVGGIVGGAGTLALTKSPRLAMAGAVTGAGVAGGAEQMLEEFFGGPPPPDTTMGGRVTRGVLEQGGSEVLGHATMWPLKAVTKRLTQSTVGKYAYNYLQQEKQAALAALQRALRVFNNERAELQRAVTTATRYATQATGRTTRAETAAVARQGEQAVAGAEREAADRLARAQVVGAEGVAGAERGGAARLADFESGYQAGRPPLAEAAAGRAAAAVVTGPAHVAKQTLGEAIDRAAETGPPINVLDLQEEAERLLRSEVLPAEQAFPRQTPSQFTQGPPPPLALDDPLDALTRRISEAEAEELARHPALQVINRIRNAASTVTFQQAHQWKQQLQDSLRGTYSQAVRDKVTGMIDHLAGMLRGKLAVHEPYNAATAAYAELVPVFEEGYAQRIRDVARSETEKIVQMINPDDPTATRFLVNLLTEQATEGGGGKAGREALEAVQSQWVNRNLIEGPAHQLAARLAALRQRPEFVSAFLSDPKASIILDNLDAIATAQREMAEEVARVTAAAKAAEKGGVAHATREGRDLVEGARTTAKAATEAAQTAGRERVRATREAGDVVREETRRETSRGRLERQDALTNAQTGTPEGRAFTEFMASTLAPSKVQAETGAQLGADTYNVVANLFRNHASFWVGMSGMRLLRGASDADMLKYVAFSPAATRRLVEWTHSPAMRRAVAALVRPAIPSEPPPEPPGLNLTIRGTPSGR